MGRMGAAIVGMELAALIVAVLAFGWPVLLVGAPLFVGTLVALAVVRLWELVRRRLERRRATRWDQAAALPGGPDERFLRGVGGAGAAAAAARSTCRSCAPPAAGPRAPRAVGRPAAGPRRAAPPTGRPVPDPARSGACWPCPSGSARRAEPCVSAVPCRYAHAR